jgi:hypothetical protein
VGDDSHFVFLQILLGEDRSVRRGVVMVKQPSLFLPKFGATSSHVFKQSPQNFAVKPGIHGLAPFRTNCLFCHKCCMMVAPVWNILDTTS